jgi:hypothetical protein
MPGNHAYLWDHSTSSAAGRRKFIGASITPGEGDNEKGPSGDACRIVKDSEGKEKQAMDDMKTWGNWGVWMPFANDCQNSVERVLRANGLESPGVPGGRFGNPNPTYTPGAAPPSSAANAPGR